MKTKQEMWNGVRTADVRGTQLAYREAGTGDPVVFVHGGLSDMTTWSRQLSDLSDEFRVLTPSRRYASPNPDIPADADDQIIDHADDLAGFIESTGAAPAHLVGNSWGAFVSLMTAIRRPDLVRSLVLEEPPVIPLFIGAGSRPQAGAVLRSLARHPRATWAVLKFGATVVAPATKAFQAGDAERAWRGFASGVLGPDAFARWPEERFDQAARNASALRAQFLGAGFPALDPAALRALTTPVLLVYGADSHKFLGAFNDALARLLPHSERVVIPNATHVMHEQNPAAVHAALRTFLAAH